MSSNVTPLFETNVAPTRDGEMLAQAVQNAIELIGQDEFANALIGEHQPEEARRAA